MIDHAAVGSRIRRERERRGLSIQEAATGCGVDATSLGSFEHGTRRIGLTSLILISRFFRCSCDYLLTGKVTPFLQLDRESEIAIEIVQSCSDKEMLLDLMEANYRVIEGRRTDRE